MASLSFPQTTPFDAVTGDLLPHYRDAYLHGQLAPTVALQVEQYLKTSSIQTGVALGRYHELAAAAQLRGRTVVPPLWVRQRLLMQPTVAAAGPLRRPVVRLVLGLFAVLSTASVVQWVRNEPLVPVQVVAAVSRVASSASAATTQLVAQFSARPAAEAPARGSAPARRAVPDQPLRQPAAPLIAAATDATAPTAPAAADSLTLAAAPATPAPVPVPVPDATADLPTPTATAAAPARAGTVRGRISDASGRPLVGATVLVKGTAQGTSTDAVGNYELAAPSGAILEYGYAGCADVLRSATLGTMDVVLHPNIEEKARRKLRLHAAPSSATARRD